MGSKGGLMRASVAVVVVSLGLFFAGCGGCDNNGSGSPDAPPGTLDAQTECVSVGDACTSSNQCCSGACDVDTCIPPGGCVAAGDECQNTLECCGGMQCQSSGGTAVCVVGLCVEETGACTIDSDCCSLNCEGNV